MLLFVCLTINFICIKRILKKYQFKSGERKIQIARHNGSKDEPFQIKQVPNLKKKGDASDFSHVCLNWNVTKR